MRRTTLAYLALFISAVTSLGISSAAAQDTTSSLWRQRLGLSFGTTHIANEDNVGSPLIYSGASYPIGAAYIYDGQKNRQQLTCYLVVSPINASPLRTEFWTDQSPKKAYFALGQLRYEYVRDLAQSRDGYLKLRIGAALDNQFFGRYYRYTGNNAKDAVAPGSLSGEGLSSVCAVGELSYKFGERHIGRLSIGLPLIAYVIRPPYSLFATGNSVNVLGWALGQGKIELLGRIAAYEASLRYALPLSSLFDLELNAHSDYYYYPDDLWRSASILNGVSALLSLHL